MSIGRQILIDTCHLKFHCSIEIRTVYIESLSHGVFIPKYLLGNILRKIDLKRLPYSFLTSLDQIDIEKFKIRFISNKNLIFSYERIILPCYDLSHDNYSGKVLHFCQIFFKNHSHSRSSASTFVHFLTGNSRIQVYSI